MRTTVTDLLGIDLPILAFSHCRDVVAAVSKAGGMGVLGAVAHSPEQLEIDLHWIEEELGDRPYGVDLIVPAKYAGDEGGGYTLDDIRQLLPADAQAFVDDILRRYDVPELPPNEPGTEQGLGRAAGAAPFSASAAGPQLAHREAGRMLRSSWTDEWDRSDTPDPLGMPLQTILTAQAQARINRAAHTPGSGAEQLANYFVGQIVGSMNRSQPAARVVYEMIDELIDVVAALARDLDAG